MIRKILFGCLLLALTPSITLAEVNDTERVQKLQQGGFVILVRHSLAENTKRDTDFVNLENCEAQRNLTQAGKEQARVIGKYFKALKIPAGKIYSSFFCRCVDTANLAFGKPEKLLGLSSYMKESTEGKKHRVSVIRNLLGTPTPTMTNTIIVTHSNMLFEASGVRLGEGNAAVFLPGKNNQFEFIDFIISTRWQKMFESTTEDM